MEKKLTKGMLMTALICGTISMVPFGAVAHAEDAAADDAALQGFNLDQIVVTATRTEKSILETPANASVITAKDIQDKGYLSVFEAVRDATQANAHTYQEDGGDYGGMMSRIRIRGIDSGTLVLINGIPATHGNYSTVSTIPMSQIEKIEVVKGSNSVLYGAQAMGGVINVITKKPGEGDKKVHGDVSGSIGSRYKDFGLNVRTDIVNVGYKKSWTSDFYNAAPGPNGNMPGVNLLGRQKEEIYADAKLAKDLTLSYGRTHSKGTYQTNYGFGWSDDYNDYKFNTYSLLYDSKETGWRVAAGYNTRSVKARDYDLKYSGYNANLDVQKRFKLNQGKDSLLVGFDVKRDSMKTKTSPTGMYYPWLGGTERKNGYTTYSLFQSYDHKFTDKFSMILGLREFWVNKSENQGRDFQLLPQLQGLYKLNDTSSAYFNIGKSYIMPSADTGFYNGPILPNTDLKPQSGWTYEAGYKFENEKSSLTADVFHMDVKDRFYWGMDTLSGKSILLNGKKWKNTGVEVNYKQKINDNFDFNLGVTVQNPKLQANDGTWGQDTAKYILNVGTNYHKNKFMADLRLFSYLKREQAFYGRDGSYTRDHKLKDYHDLTLSVTYKPTSMDTFQLTGYNLLNRKDFINSYEYYTAPARYVFRYERKF